MRWITLEAVSDEYDTAPGFALADAKRYEGFMADRGDVLLAHDIVEHQNGLASIGPIWDELEAMGGIWHARGQWGDMMTPSQHSPQVNCASDITRMARDLVNAVSPRDFDTLRRAPVTRPSLYDEDFLEILDIARRDIPAEIEDLETDFDVEEYLADALGRMRIGFRKCERRFSYSRFASYEQFKAISEAVKAAAPDIEFEGQRFRLGWGQGKCEIQPLYGEY
jgi:hypothetical protein